MTNVTRLLASMVQLAPDYCIDAGTASYMTVVGIAVGRGAFDISLANTEQKE